MDNIIQSIEANYDRIEIYDAVARQEKTINNIYYLDTNVGRLVLKVFTADDKNQIENSVFVQDVLSGKGLAPEIVRNKKGYLCTGNNGSIYFIQRFMEKKAEDKNQIEHVVNAVTQLHQELSSIPCTALKNKCMPALYGDIKHDIICMRDNVNKKKLNDVLFDEIYGLLDLREKLLEEYKLNYMPRVQRVIHGDLRPSNILSNGNKIIFIDFDYVALGDFWYEVSGAAMLMGAYSHEYFERFIQLYMQENPYDIRKILLHLCAYYVQSTFPLKLLDKIPDNSVITMIRERRRALRFCELGLKRN